MSRLSAVVASLLAVSCAPPNPTPRSSGSIAVSNDDALLFVADADHDVVVVLDAASGAVLRQTKVGRQPERLLVGPDGAVYVSCRADRSVARLSAGGEVVEATATVGAEPVGMALSADRSRLLVANSMSGTLSVLEAQSLAVRREVRVGGQPWALAASPDGRRVYVTDFGAGALRVVDLDVGSGPLRTLEQPPEAECGRGLVPRRTPAQAADVVLSPDGDRAYVAHVQSRTGGVGRVQTSLRLAVAPALSTVETTNDALLVDDARTRAPWAGGEAVSSGFPAALLSTNLDAACGEARGGTGMDAPSALVVDASGAWVYVVDHNSNAVAVVSATGRVDERYRVPERGIADVVRVGARPTGIAVAGDLTRAWVHNALDYTVSLVESRGGRLAQTAVIPFAHPTQAPDVERGRRLFYSAVDPRLTQPEFGGVSCSSCHPDGRTDGLSWVLPASRGGPRNTPPLWGVTATAPYHWDGALADLPAFSTRMVTQMGGRGLSRGDVADLSAYLATVPAPDNPAVERVAPGLVARGEALFASRCASCHAGAVLTDGLAHGSTLSGAPKLDTPSLRGVFASAPYLHDGSATSLRQVLLDPRASMAEHDQRALSAADLDALEGFLSTR
ncbi:MAG: c-type cytochrome [Myxococcus sp.]|nr:c-type cytochrome [Myxococcus sp.]